jgi:hypothetical protein
VLIGRLLSTNVDQRTDPPPNHNIYRIKRSAWQQTDTRKDEDERCSMFNLRRSKICRGT